MVTLGFRIDFYDKPARQPDEDPNGYLGTVVTEDSYTAEAVPAVGEFISVVNLRVGPSGIAQTPLRFPGRHPFLQVREVQHHPVPIGSDSTAGVIVVLYAELGYDGERLADFVRNYAEAGWHWMPAEHGPLAAAVADYRRTEAS